MKNKLGFTLLELLVVVIIIAILAAIALPKYQLAVDKAEFSKYQSMVSSLVAAYDEYYMTHGVGTSKFEDLSFTMPSDFVKVHENSTYKLTCVQNRNMFCCMSDSGSNNSALIDCGKNDLSIIYAEILFSSNYNTIRRNGRCVTPDDNARGQRLCASLGTIGNLSNIWIPTSGVSSWTYRYYKLN